MTPLRLSLVLLLLLTAAAVDAGDEDSYRGADTLPVRLEGGPAASSSDPGRWRVSVRLTGALAELRGGDVNDGVALWTGAFESYLYNEVVGLQPGDDGEPAALRGGAEYGADVIVHLTPRVAIVGGIGRIEGSSDGAVEHAVVYGQFFPVRGETRNATALGASSVPVRLGAQYTTSVGRRVKLAVEGGAGLYFTRLYWSHELAINDRRSGWVSQTRGRDFGLHGAVWVDVGLTDRFGLVFGVEAVRAEVAGLHGFREGTFSYRPPTRDDGVLSLTGPEPPQFLIVGQGSWLNEFWGESIMPVREAALGLSGLRLRGGLRVGL